MSRSWPGTIARSAPLRKGEFRCQGEQVLPAVGRGSRGNLAKSGYKSGSGIGVSQSFEVDCSRELWGLGAEADLQNVLPPRRHQRVEFGAGILLPARARGEDYRAGLV